MFEGLRVFVEFFGEQVLVLVKARDERLRERTTVRDRLSEEQQRWPGAKHGVKGAIAQLGERLICIQEVRGSIPRSSTIT